MPAGVLGTEVAPTLLGFAHVLGWAVYIGGAVLMEVVWRPSQEHIPPAQVNVVCSFMGRRYRWIALAALAALFLSGVGLLLESGHLSTTSPIFRPPLVLSNSYGRTMLALTILWAFLFGLLLMLGVVAHPALHVRMSSDMSDEERRAARAAVGQAIRRMDVLLRVELAGAGIAAFLGTTLRFGGIL